MSSLTKRYTGSPESAMEFDLARFREIKDKDEYISILNTVADSILTGDYWSITLPTDLATSAARSPSQFSYYAALILLDAKALWSNLKISDIQNPDIIANKSSVEKHHLFPFNYLKGLGYTSTRDTNQIANFALLEWSDNINISDQAPKDYVPIIEKRFSKADLEKMYYWHALPKDWHLMDYPEFLNKRRELIAKVVGDGYLHLSKDIDHDPEYDHIQSVSELVSHGENVGVEYKSTLRINLHTGQKDEKMEYAVLKTITGFLNARGGDLLIGVDDNGHTIGVRHDKFENHDKMNLHLINLIKDKIGPQYMMYLTVRFSEHDDRHVMTVNCKPSNKEVFLKENNTEKFYLRTGGATVELTGHQMQDYIRQHFS